MSQSETNKPGSTTPTSGLPEGLLSFFYNVSYNTETTQGCQQDPVGTLMSFGIRNKLIVDTLVNVQDAGSAQAGLDIEVFNECMEFVRNKYKDSPSLQKKLNSLIISQALCENLSECYEIVW